MTKIKYLFLALALLLVTGQNAFALQCNPSRDAQGSSDQCWSSVVVASNETTLVSIGTVLVYDIANAQFSSDNGAFQVRVATASANGVIVAGVAQQSYVSGQTALVLVRGKGVVATKTNDAVVSGNALFVSTSGDAAIVPTSTTQTQLGFALETETAVATSSRGTTNSYVTIV